jgi:uncharacterized membrane protein
LEDPEVNPQFIEAIVTHWASFYANHATARTIVTFIHVAPLIASAGTAFTVDRDMLGWWKLEKSERLARLAKLRDTHRTVMAGLGLIVVSGVLLLASDLDAFLHSKFFWIKMALVALLLVNGGYMLIAERRAFADADSRSWSHLRLSAAFSLALWLLTTLAGVTLPNVG